MTLLKHSKPLFFCLAVLATLRNESLFFASFSGHYHQSLRYNTGTVRSLETPDSSTSAYALPSYPSNGPVIATLVSGRQKDVIELTTALKSLKFLQGDKNDLPAPILVFNEGDLTANQTKQITESTDRPVMFPLVDFTDFPEGFDPNKPIGVGKHFRVKGRSEWGYYQMIRFWITGIWKHPALESYGTVMRIDSDSCFKQENSYLPKFESSSLVYHSEFVGNEDGKEFTIGLYEFAVQFMMKNDIKPKNPMLWQLVKSTWETQKTLPLFMTNFELNSKAFMQQPDVAAWHEALTEQKPFGIFKYRWGDAVERFLTIAMFASNEMLMPSHPDGYGHKDQCSKEDVEAVLASLS